MAIQDMLPSQRFTTIVGSIALAAFLVWGAYALTHPTPSAPSEVAVSGNSVSTSADWKQTLDQIQAQSPLNKAPQAPSDDKVNTLITAATSDNLTDTVARTLFVNLSAAKAQGLGNDIPTQDTIIADAAARISQEAPSKTFATQDLTIADNTKAAQTTYGNAIMAAVGRHPKANHDTVLYIVATSTDTASLSTLKTISREYAALAEDIADLPVPQTLAPIHLKIANNLERMSQAVLNMQKIYTDPLRALAGLQTFDALNDETYNLFINIAQDLSQNGILFNKDDPGAAWSTLVP